MDAFFLVPFPGFKYHTCQFFVGFRMEKVWGAKDWKTEDAWIFWTRNLYKRFLLSPTCPEVPKMEDFLNHMFGFFGRWVYPYHIQPIGEDSSILGTWNVWWGQFPFPPAPVRIVQGKKGITKTKQMMRTLWLLLWRRYLTKRYLTLPKFNIPPNFPHIHAAVPTPPPPQKKSNNNENRLNQNTRISIFVGKNIMPGDSKWPNFIPDRWRSFLTIEKGHVNSPSQKGHLRRIARSIYGCFQK